MVERDRAPPCDADLRYTALIRTRDSHPLVEAVVAALRAQTLPPSRIVAVDSGSSSEQHRLLAALVDDVVDYPAEPFNYSKAINLGVPRCATPWILIISSHVVIEDREAMARASTEMRRQGAFAFYLWSSESDAWKAEIVDRRRFDGHNGLHNTCAFVPTDAVARRPFREEVFSAEDQEWSAHFIREHDARILRIGTSAMRNRNPHVNHLKFINEEISIAYFTCRERLGVAYLASWLARSALAFVRGRHGRSRAHLKIFRELMLARVRPPKRTSSYY